jgi:anthranilate phosphoribosyltransferase
MLAEMIAALETGTCLASAQIADAVAALADPEVPTDHKAGFLTALARKGETPAEIAAFAQALRNKAVVPPLDPKTRAGVILDIVGTGGDRLGTFNISTTSSLVVAAAGVTVAKHGNRAVTSTTGSADVIETLGVPIDLPPDQAAASLRDHGFAFFFAPRYHPAFRHIAPARKLCADRGQRTLFNYLGPLLNPARPTAQLMGIPQPDLCQPLAQVLQSLGVRHGMVVCGRVPVPTPASVSPPGAMAMIDEISILGPTTVAEFHQEHGTTVSTLNPKMFPMRPATLDDLRGGDRNANAEIVRLVLRGEDRGPRRDAVLLNAGAALFVAGRVRSILEGWELARATLDSGAAWNKLCALSGGGCSGAGS